MSREILQDIIGGFSPDKFTRFFREKNRSFAPRQESFNHYNDEYFTDGIKLGEIKFSESEKLVVCAFKASQPLSERTGKKAQYEKGKKILKDTQSDAGIFIFYDKDGNFRFSLIYPKAIGNRRQWSNFRRFTYFVNCEFTNKTFLQRIGDGDFSSLEKIKDAFSVEKVTKEFYEDIANWYFWAVQHSIFPKDAEVEENGRNIAVIRLITRMIFIWFMREKSLVPKNLFEEKSILAMLKEISPESSTYYQAILQNLFFATLSTKKDDRKFRSEIRGYKGYNPDFGNQNVFRSQEFFKNPEKLKDYFGEIPFLNGGLFGCRDDKPNGIYIDGFTDVKKNQPNVPNILFFSEEKKANLNSAYGTKSKTYKVRGFLDILSSFNFTIDENSPDDQDIALDPELLGRVFENLLASFNPETSTTARKATGSYYTPREIVDYMVTESLKAYFKTQLSAIEDLDKKIDQLFISGSEENSFNKSESKKIVELIESVRILDPAVGSGAFPMGALNKLVFILNKVDPGNELWKQAQLLAADAIPDPRIKSDTKNRIDEFFKGKNADYGRKLYLIQKCIYGVDIQQIAVEIAKLRFFISLLVDEEIDKTKENWGIEPLPNLDFKIMQGNSLLEEYEGVKLFDEKLIANIDFDKQKLIESIKQKQLELQKEYLDLHAKNKLTKIKQVELNEELKKLDKQLKGLNKQDNKTEESAGLFDSQNQAKQKRGMLKRLHKEFFETNEKETKGKIKKQIEKIGWDLIEATLKEQNKTSELKKLEQFKKSNTRPFFLWKLHFADVFENGGFDIVIANPPYVRQEEISYKLALQKEYTIFNSVSDLYTYFYERGFNLLKNSGTLTFITSNKFLRARYGVVLRMYLKANTTIKSIINFGDQHVFDAITNTLIFVSTKKKAGNNTFNYSDSLEEPNKITFPQSGLQYSEWTIENTEVIRLKNKIERLGMPLKDWDIRINRGLLTGYNDAFIVNEATKNELIKKDPKAKEIIKPIIRGRDIKRYHFVNSGLYFIVTHNGYRSANNEIIKAIDIDKLPSIKSHLDKYIRQLKERQDKGVTIYNLRDCAFMHDFAKEKIIWIELTNENKFAYSDKEDYLLAGAFFLVGKSLKYLLAFLNSKLCLFYFSLICNSSGMATIQWKKFALEKVPVMEITGDEQKPFIDLVDKTLAITKSSDYLENSVKKEEVKKHEKQIDQMVYKLYALTLEEIAIIEGGKK